MVSSAGPLAMSDSRTLLNIQLNSVAHAVYLLSYGRWVCAESGVSLDHARETATSIFERCEMPIEIRTHDGTIVDRWEPGLE
jgi:hypothetical protein